ncbi:MAG: hypothetical protein ACRD0U_13040 [Acidimicrobiales bacterium]
MLQAMIEAGEAVLYVKVCEDTETGELISWEEDLALDLPAVPQVDPRLLALMARSRLPFPLPDVAFSPALDGPGDMQLVHLPMWIWVENWGTESRSATAGSVTATVQATPVRQTWDFAPDRSDPRLEGGCAVAGTPYDSTRPLAYQSTPCTFTFTRSSVGEQGAAYEAHITVVYEVTWTSTIPGTGGNLGEVRRTTVVPVPVGEAQAVNVGR